MRYGRILCRVDVAVPRALRYSRTTSSRMKGSERIPPQRRPESKSRERQMQDSYRNRLKVQRRQIPRLTHG